MDYKWRWTHLWWESERFGLQISEDELICDGVVQGANMSTPLQHQFQTQLTDYCSAWLHNTLPPFGREGGIPQLNQAIDP